MGFLQFERLTSVSAANGKNTKQLLVFGQAVQFSHTQFFSFFLCNKIFSISVSYQGKLRKTKLLKKSVSDFSTLGLGIRSLWLRSERLKFVAETPPSKTEILLAHVAVCGPTDEANENMMGLHRLWCRNQESLLGGLIPRIPQVFGESLLILSG